MGYASDENPMNVHNSTNGFAIQPYTFRCTEWGYLLDIRVMRTDVPIHEDVAVIGRGARASARLHTSTLSLHLI